MKKGKKPNFPPAEDLTFTSTGSKAIYEHLLYLYQAVGELKGTQKVILGILMALLAAIIATGVRVWSG